MFHHVTDDYINTHKSCVCTIEEFQKVLSSTVTEGRIFVSPQEMMSIIEEEKSIKFSVVTFDDVPADFYTNAYPILKERQIPFTLFITIDFCGKEGFLSIDQIKSLDKDELCTIGAHTLTHPLLRTSSSSCFELTQSKKKLENILGHSVDYMAYPYGRHSSVSERIKKEAAAAGYICAFGTIPSPITDLSSRSLFFLPRIVKK